MQWARIHTMIGLSDRQLFWKANTCTLKRELVETNAYKMQPTVSEGVVVDGHGHHTALHFGVKAKENQDKVHTLYWLSKLHKNHIKLDLLLILVLVWQQNFLSKLLTSWHTAVKNMLSSTVKRHMRYPVKIYFRKCGEILDKFKARDFNATSLFTYDFSTLNITLPHNLISNLQWRRLSLPYM